MESSPAMVPVHADDTNRFEQLVAAHEARLLRYAARLVNDVSLARDVVQDAFIKLHRFLSEGNRLEADPSRWLYRVVHNCAVDTIRKESRLRVLQEEQAAETEAFTWPDPFPENERLQQVLALLPSLKLSERTVVLLRLQEGKSYREIAEITGFTEGNVGYLLFQAVQKLSNRLRKQGLLASQD